MSKVIHLRTNQPKGFDMTKAINSAASKINARLTKKAATCKAVEFYTPGQGTQIALSEEGNWFIRTYGYNGYGKGWGKWQEHTFFSGSSPRPTNRWDTNENSPTWNHVLPVTEEYAKDKICYGSHNYTKLEKTPRVRLPKLG